MAEGVFKEDILNFFRTDRICVLRSILDEKELEQVLEKAKSMEGLPYDFGFNFTNANEVSCSEFVYVVYQNFDAKLGMFKSIENILFKKKIMVRPALFLEFPGFKKILEC